VSFWGKFELNFKQDPLFEMRERWLEYVLLPLAMNMVYSHVQFHFQMNEVFKSKVDLKQELNGTKKSKNSLVQY